MRLDGLLGAQVPIGPRLGVLTHLDHRHVEGPQPFADLFERGEHPGVAGVVGSVSRTEQSEPTPERSILVEHLSARRVARGRHHQLHVAECVALPPIELDDALGGYTPILEVCTHTQRTHERRVAVLQRDDGRMVEVVIVVVRDQDRVDGGNVFERQRRRVPAPRTEPRDGRGRRHRGCGFSNASPCHCGDAFMASSRAPLGAAPNASQPATVIATTKSVKIVSSAPRIRRNQTRNFLHRLGSTSAVRTNPTIVLQRHVDLIAASLRNLEYAHVGSCPTRLTGRAHFG